MPGHILVTRRLLLDPLSQDDLHHLGDIMTRVRDHMRALPPAPPPPASAAPPPPPRLRTPRQAEPKLPPSPMTIQALAGDVVALI